MALIAHSSLPAFASLASEGLTVVTPDEAASSGRPDLWVGLLNLMPDAALRATDRQFMRLLAAASDSWDIWVRPFTVAASGRGAEARSHIADHYSSFAEIEQSGIDALIVTGANPAQELLEREAFWEGLGEVLDWAQTHTRSVLCSCLATHAVLERFKGLKRTRLPEKRWGVYQHGIVAAHPLLEGLTGPVAAPHSHWYDVTRGDMEAIGLTVLIESDEAGVHMAVGDDDFYVFFQGHPEYDPISLLKEYRRELGRYYLGERSDYPPAPEHYFDDAGLAMVEEYHSLLDAAKTAATVPPGLDETRVLPRHMPDWASPGKVIYRNWLSGLVP
ncbi:MAG: homoserine O-succinyltransferase [Acidimicrobiia bacterium]